MTDDKKHDEQRDREHVEALRVQLRATFDDVAALYDAVRPGYPVELYDDIRTLSGVPDGGDILEIGCGTGQATLPLAQRGYRITCVELGAELAALARRNLAAYPNVEVRVGAFETEPLPEASFDLVISATAFHWVAPKSYPKLARVLRPEGAIALFWNKHIAGAVDGGFFDQVQSVYRQHAPEFTDDWKGLPSADELPDESAALAATGLFSEFTVRRYPWVAHYDAVDYVNQLATYSDHLALPADRRQRLQDGIANVIDGEFGGEIAKQYLAVLYVAHLRL
ncbi:MAG TPA: methyltransferase domain-containing protein [Ktedonobacterales bacterium]|nr:methyltransferase domain-containing protein [Ktedonobacterales bacterium]